MKDNVQEFLIEFVRRQPEETKKRIGWTDPQDTNSYEKKIKEANTTALLKLYGQLKFHEESMEKAFDRLLHAVELEFEKKEILLKNKHHDNLKQIVYEVFSEIVLNEMGIEEDIECCKFIVIIRQYVDELKEIPQSGNQYFHVLNETFLLNRYNLSSKKMLLVVGMPRTSYYRAKKQAISTLATLIWR